MLQLRPYHQPHVSVAVTSAQSPAGPRLAGHYGASFLSLSVPRDTVRRTSLQELWSIAEEPAAEDGKTMCGGKTGIWSFPCIWPKAGPRLSMTSGLAEPG